MLWSQKIAIFFVPNHCSYGQLAKIQKIYLSLRLWSNRERLLEFQLLNSRESKFGDICGDKWLGIIISLQKLIKHIKNEILTNDNRLATCQHDRTSAPASVVCLELDFRNS
jgi:hypothetical protein